MNPAQPDPAYYEIRLEGHLSRQWEGLFEGLAIAQMENGDTLLSGIIADQSALHGLLRKVRDLGLPLLSVNQLPNPEEQTNQSFQEKK